MSRGFQFLFLLLLADHLQSHDANYDFSVNVSVSIISSLRDQFKTGCLLLVLSGERIVSTFQVFKMLTSRESFSVIVTFDKVIAYSQDVRCRQNRPLYVITSDDSSAQRNLQGLSTKLDMAYPRWLMFFSHPRSVEEFFKNVDVPFNCEFFLAERNENQVQLSEVYRVHESKPLHKVPYAVWTLEAGLQRTSSELLYERRSNLQRLTLKVTAYNDPPMVKVVKRESGKVDLKGYFGDVWVILARRMNFIFKYVEPPDRAGGSLFENGSASGMVGLLLSRRADVAVRASTMTSDRAAAVDFVFPMIFTKNFVFIRKPTSRHRGMEAFLAPFSLGLWLAVGLCIVVFALHLTVLHHFGYRCGNAEVEGSRHSFLDFMFYIHGLFCQQGHDVTPRSLSCRIVYLSACLVSILLLASYSATIVSFITTPKLELPFESMQGLLDQKAYTLGVKANSALLNDFAEAHDPVMQQVYRKFLAKHRNHPPDIHTGLKRVCKENGYAFMASYTVVRSAFPVLPCKVVPLQGATIPENIAMAVTKNSPYRDLINYHLLELRRVGVLHRLFIHYWPPDPRKVKDSFMRVSADEVKPPLALLASGILAAILCLLAERLWSRLVAASSLNDQHRRARLRGRRKTF